MGDVAGFGGDGHTTFGHGASVGFVGNGIALGVNLSQGMIHRVVHLQLEHNITKFMLATGNKATFLFSLGRKKFFLLVVGDREALATSLTDRPKGLPWTGIAP